MRIILLIIVFAFSINKLCAIEQYSIGDKLFIWANKLNIRESPTMNSKIIGWIAKGEKVIMTQSKLNKSEDISLATVDNVWNRLLTGKWTKIFYNGIEGYVFDLYLSKYDYYEVSDLRIFSTNDTIANEYYNSFVRLTTANGVVKEIGTSNEWGVLNYYILDLSIEEGILLIKEEFIDNKYGIQKWEYDSNEQKLQISEVSESSWRNGVIKKTANILIITIEDGV